MTKQEAINELKDWKQAINTLGEYKDKDVSSTLEALDMAVVALGCEKVAESHNVISRKRAYDRGYERCRQDAVKTIKKMAWENDNKFGNARDILLDGAKELDSLPSAQVDLLDDGTLLITVPHGILSDVKRVLVDEVGTKFCKVMYQDEPERKRGE